MRKPFILLMIAGVLLAVGIAQMDWVANGQVETGKQLHGTIKYQGNPINTAIAFLKREKDYTGGAYNDYDGSHSGGQYGFSGLSTGYWYTVWAVKDSVGKISERHSFRYMGREVEQDLDLTEDFRSKIYGYVKKNGQPVEDAGMNVWAIDISSGNRKDWPGVFTDANGYYEHSWQRNGFYIWASPYPDDDVTFYSQCILPARLGRAESNPKTSKDPYPSSDPNCRFSWHTGPPQGWWWRCDFSFKTKP